MRRVGAVIAGLLAVLTMPSVESTGALAIARFRTPSRNISCGAVTGFGAPYLRCEIRSGVRPLPPKPASCEFDWGAGYSLTLHGRARVLCISDTIASPSAPILRYGRTWRRGGFTCRSRITGLRCSNRAGHGFFLSRQRSYGF